MVKNQISENRSLVIEFIGIQEEAYQQLFFETAVKWADKQTENSKEGSAYLTSQSLFWGWWAMEYSRVEEEFLECFHFDEKFQRYLYIQMGSFTKKEYDKIKMYSLYADYMDHRMNECTSGSKIMELSFHKALK